MLHNEQVRKHGQCRCKCHESWSVRCQCGLSPYERWLLGPEHQTRKPRRVKLESRVKAFGRGYTLPIAVSKGHLTHAPTLKRKGPLSEEA